MSYLIDMQGNGIIKAVFLEDSSDMGIQDKLEGLDYKLRNHLGAVAVILKAIGPESEKQNLT